MYVFVLIRNTAKRSYPFYLSVLQGVQPYAADEKMLTMKGFVYTPRTDSPNGYVKDYEIYVSEDNNSWTKIHSGTFARDGRPQKIIFQKPVRARYIRFYALNEQGGAEYASGAEFSLITE